MELSVPVAVLDPSYGGLSIGTDVFLLPLAPVVHRIYLI